MAIAAALAAIACLVTWLAHDVHRAPAGATPPGTFRIVQWNVGRPTWRIAPIAERVLAWKPDVLVLNESRPDPATPEPRWHDALAPLDVTPLRQLMLMAAHGPAERLRVGTFGGYGEYDVRRVSLGGRDVTILVVDVDGAPLRSRRDAFERIGQLVRWYDKDPLLVIGDFNTPTDSAWFPPLLAEMQEAFETGGSGLAGTWPSPLPVLALDHVLASRHFRVVRCEHRTSWLSDHRALVVDLAWADVTPAAAAP